MGRYCRVPKLVGAPCDYGYYIKYTYFMLYCTLIVPPNEPVAIKDKGKKSCIIVVLQRVSQSCVIFIFLYFQHYIIYQELITMDFLFSLLVIHAIPPTAHRT